MRFVFFEDYYVTVKSAFGMKKLFYVVAFAIPIAIMFVGLLKGDMKLLTFGFSLLFLFYCAFIGTSIKEMTNLKISKVRLSLVIAMFLLSVALIAVGSVFDFLIPSIILAVIIGVSAIVILLKSRTEH